VKLIRLTVRGAVAGLCGKAFVVKVHILAGIKDLVVLVVVVLEK